MTILLDMFDVLGRTTWEPVWGPVLIWTALAGPAWLFLKKTDWFHPRAEYRLSQGLLAVLPIGIGAGLVVDVVPEPSSALSVTGVSSAVLPSVQVTDGAPPPSSWQWAHTVGLLTASACIAALASFSRLVLDGVAAWRARAGSLASPPPFVLDLFERAKDRLGVKRSLEVRISAQVDVPITVGGPQPMVLLPKKLVMDEEALQMIAFHELVHVQRYDDWTHVVERLVGALFVVHPLVGRLLGQIRKARERACDAVVLDVEDTSAASYARLILGVANGSPLPRSTGALALSESSSSLKTRLAAIRSTGPNRLSSPGPLRSVLFIGGLAFVLGIAACSESVGPASAPPVRESSSGQALQFKPNEDQPLYVVNGTLYTSPAEFNTENFDSDDITSIEVLSESAATEAYGERGVHGALIITTKQGNQQESSNTTPTDDDVSTLVEEQPECGGRRALQENIRYPQRAQDAGLEGRVLVTFTVNKDGRIQAPQVTRGEHRILNRAAVQGVTELDCEPGVQNGRPVKVQMSMPVLFQLPKQT